MNEDKVEEVVPEAPVEAVFAPAKFVHARDPEEKNLKGFRFNFYLKDTDDQTALREWVSESGRSQADLVRQLMQEVVDKKRTPGIIPKPRVRTNTVIPHELITKFVEAVRKIPGAPEYVDAKDVLTELIAEFLEDWKGP